jgi:hypothetical protein
MHRILVALLALLVTSFQTLATPLPQVYSEDSLSLIVEEFLTAAPEHAVQQVQDWAERDDVPVDVRERVLHEYAQALGELPHHPLLGQLLQELATFAPKSLTLGHEGRRWVPRYDIPGAAEGTLNQWRRQELAGQAAIALARSDIGYLLGLTRDADGLTQAAVADGVLLALAAMPKQSATPFVEQLAAALASHPGLTATLYAVGVHWQHAGLLRTVIRDGADPWPARALANLDEWLQPGDARDIQLEMARGRRPDLAGIAMQSLAEKPDDAIRNLLFDRLKDDRTGAAAAMALGRLADASTVDRLSALLNSPQAQPIRARAALALKLNGSSKARAELSSFAVTAKGPLAEHVRSWLK